MMTPQESQSLREFLDQLTQVRGISKDPQAGSMIAAAVAQQPDAAYLLVQRALLQDQALNAARAQLAQLQSQLQAEREAARGGAGGFLDPASAWGNSAYADPRATGMAPARSAQRYDNPSAPQYNAPAPQYSAPPPQQFAPAPQARSGFFGGGGGGGSFLGSMAATAAGVAGGAFLFQGIENLMGHHGGASGLMGQAGGALPAENTTINNFYGAENDGAGSNAGNERMALADDSFDDTGSNDDFGNNDDLGSSDDMSSI